MPRLLIRKGEGAGQDHPLSVTCIVGRHASAQFVLGDQLVSRNHFRVVQEAGAWFVEDLGSTNGTIVNGRRATKQRLADGDVIVVGATELQFVQKDLLAGNRAAPPVAVAPAARAPVAPRTVVAPEPVKPVVPVPPVVPHRPVMRAVPAVPVAPAKPAAPAAGPPAAPPAPPKAPTPTPRRLRK